MFGSICPLSVLSFLMNSHTHFLPHIKKGEHMDQGQKVHTPHVSLIPGREGSDSRTDLVHVSFGFIKTFHRLWNLGVDTTPCSHTYSYLH